MAGRNRKKNNRIWITQLTVINETIHRPYIQSITVDMHVKALKFKRKNKRKKNKLNSNNRKFVAKSKVMKLAGGISRLSWQNWIWVTCQAACHGQTEHESLAKPLVMAKLNINHLPSRLSWENWTRITCEATCHGKTEHESSTLLTSDIWSPVCCLETTVLKNKTTWAPFTYILTIKTRLHHRT